LPFGRGPRQAIRGFRRHGTGSWRRLSVSGSTGFVLGGDPGEKLGAPKVIGGAVNQYNNTGGGGRRRQHHHGALNAAGDRGGGPFPDQTTPDISGNHQ
ncbi:MAG: hypothetical protein M3N98_05020, partial [Actinomycetota bacterium]|nr:hypothetical protein [Actinomycetota bacterium]